MPYIYSIPKTNKGLDKLKENIPTLDQSKLMAAFSMTGMDLEEILKLSKSLMTNLIYIDEAYVELHKCSKHFLEQFATANNKYFFSIEKKLNEFSTHIFQLEKLHISFLPSDDWHFIQKDNKTRRNLYSNSTLSSNAPLCYDMFPEMYPFEVKRLIDYIQHFCITFKNCVKIVENTKNEEQRIQKDWEETYRIFIQYRESTITYYKDNGLKRDFHNIKRNPLYSESFKYVNEKEMASAWYHNVDPILLDEFLLYKEYTKDNVEENIPIKYIAENIDSVSTTYKTTYMLAEIYMTFCNGYRITDFCREFYKYYPKNSGRVHVTSGGVDAAQNRINTGKTPKRYTEEIQELYAKYKVEQRKKVSSSTSVQSEMTNLREQL